VELNGFKPSAIVCPCAPFELPSGPPESRAPTGKPNCTKFRLDLTIFGPIHLQHWYPNYQSLDVYSGCYIQCQYSDRTICNIGTQITIIWIYSGCYIQCQYSDQYTYTHVGTRITVGKNWKPSDSISESTVSKKNTGKINLNSAHIQFDTSQPDIPLFFFPRITVIL
jgi:hypothetical protein